LDVAVPTFILQPAVENAVRHGLSAEASRCNVSVAARLTGSTLVIEVHDSGPGPAGKAGDPPREGIGISNTRARLQQAYGGRARFTLRPAPPQGCVATLEIPLATAEGGTG